MDKSHQFNSLMTLFTAVEAAKLNLDNKEYVEKILDGILQKKEKFRKIIDEVIKEESCEN